MEEEEEVGWGSGIEKTDGGGSIRANTKKEEKKSIKIKYIAVYIASLPLRFLRGML
jgi:hypothetical protein